MMIRAPEPAIETLNLRKAFGRKVAVDSLTLTVGRGEVFGFLGPNGAGKTTAVKMLTGLARPTAGSARILGQPIGNIEANRQIGYLPELFRFHEWLEGHEFLEFHGRLYGMAGPQRTRRIPEVLELVGLSARAKDKLRTYSKGMLQRIGIAQAILNDPRLVFLDEPTSALDPIGRRDVRDLIRQLAADGCTVFLNSHLLSEVELVCDRVAIVDKGKVMAMGTLSDLLSSQTELEVQVDATTPLLLDALGKLSSNVTFTDSTITMSLKDREMVPLVAEAIVRCGGKIYCLTPRHLSLEELFVSTVAEGEK
ncbi:MAG: ABC transporter ATP-binding protein [Dehalococcoidia bacterium]|nr:ABC transporter ATP-binding protein [Dehalococcoidia bacterium]